MLFWRPFPQKKNYRRQKRRFTAVLIAVLVVLGGTALGAAARLDMLNIFLQRDNSTAEKLADWEVQSTTSQGYTFTAESSVSDDETTCPMILVSAQNKTTNSGKP